jgi:PAS domain S-box-containing protein
MRGALIRRYPSTCISVALAFAVFLGAVFWHINVFRLPGLDLIGVEQAESGQIAIAFLLVIPAFLVDRAATRRRRSETQVVAEREQAYETSSRLAAIVESSDDAIIGKDLNGIITTWNRGAEDLFGYAPTEIIGTSMMALVPTDRRAEEGEILGKIKRGIGVKCLETVRLTNDGRLIDVSITSSPVRDATGRIMAASQVARDISDRRRTDAALRHERDRAQQYLDTAGVIILALDLQGCITLVNRYACSILGWEADELLGRDFIETCVPAAIRHETREKLRTVQTGDNSVLENPIVTRVGEERLIEWRTGSSRRCGGD